MAISDIQGIIQDFTVLGSQLKLDQSSKKQQRLRDAVERFRAKMERARQIKHMKEAEATARQQQNVAAGAAIVGGAFLAPAAAAAGSGLAPGAAGIGTASANAAGSLAGARC